MGHYRRKKTLLINADDLENDEAILTFKSHPTESNLKKILNKYSSEKVKAFLFSPRYGNKMYSMKKIYEK
jgi:hypothetical protein